MVKRRDIWLLLLKVTLTLAIIGGGWWLLTHRQDVIDWWRLRTYTPAADIVALADSTSMIGRGRDVFYASDPRIDDREMFNNECTDTGEESLVLGCYTLQRIFIYNVTDERLAGVKEVTAAHEMLHAAYERLEGAERTRVNKLLETEMEKLKNSRLQKLTDLYNKHEPGQLLNEMHSILGTEYTGLAPELEAYYKQYFSDRAKVVEYSQRYEAVFTASQTRLDAIDAELATLKVQVDTNNEQLGMMELDLDRESDRLNALRETNPSAYNQAVPGYNAKVGSFNALVSATRQLVAHYNNLVNLRNNEVAVQNDLYRSLDSNYGPISGQ